MLLGSLTPWVFECLYLALTYKIRIILSVVQESTGWFKNATGKLLPVQFYGIFFKGNMTVLLPLQCREGDKTLSFFLSFFLLDLW